MADKRRKDYQIVDRIDKRNDWAVLKPQNKNIKEEEWEAGERKMISRKEK
jgi:hypothetical protein